MVLPAPYTSPTDPYYARDVFSPLPVMGNTERLVFLGAHYWVPVAHTAPPGALEGFHWAKRQTSHRKATAPIDYALAHASNLRPNIASFAFECAPTGESATRPSPWVELCFHLVSALVFRMHSETVGHQAGSSIVRVEFFKVVRILNCQTSRVEIELQNGSQISGTPRTSTCEKKLVLNAVCVLES
ncbi:hypothetical protein EXIGLDRAFT_757289 [Exidia glandulosa HHB12029]|uniref:Uncharacterized protein n=1 Tax=Exidia glandulosa HHB12029 TaxID=1314781 RepID=A0A166NBP5_EXIGL|nr:hypothetical protein EXIGLDRAFT_757289 [Exidia glandulosa HHB12029]